MTWEDKRDSLFQHLEMSAKGMSECHRLNKHSFSGFKYDSAPAFWMGEGKVFDRTPFTKEEEDLILETVGGGLYHMRHCFESNQRIMTGFGNPEEKGFSYAEGLAFSVILPIEHAWLTLNGKPVDVTWRSRPDSLKRESRSKKRLMDRIRYNQQNAVYLGIEIPGKYVARHLCTVGRYSLVSEGKYDWPWMKTGVPWRQTNGLVETEA